MVDVHEPIVRSYNMSQIKGKNTKPEMIVRKFLFSHGFRYKLHEKKLPGKPDMVFPKLKKIVLVHGCYWHGHENCKYFVPPKTRTDWWMDKISDNKKRDGNNINELKKIGWYSIIVWECELKPDKRERTLDILMRELRN